MNQTPKVYSLYCINIDCETPIYQNDIKTEVVFDEKNLAATRVCASCHQPLSPSIWITNLGD
jgi:hypothetical protein